MRQYPHLYEANARIFLRRISEKYKKDLTLSTIPTEEWQLLQHKGFDLIWLMGVWQRSPGARQKALADPALRGEYEQALSGLTTEDVAGSPYAIHSYSIDPVLGEEGELARLKSKFNGLGLRLLLDFVPNHLAIDHPWTLSNPERFVQGSEEAARAHPDRFFSPGNNIYLAHGRDPYFPPWSDTVQVNFCSADMRKALIDELLKIAEIADGVRCDMAMLALNNVFEKTWGEFVKGQLSPKAEFWEEAIGQVKQKRPDFLFLAEAYWGLEQKLQDLGFDFTYDKSLYDKLRFFTPGDIRDHLTAGDSYQQHSIHFIENHDEPRAVTAFGLERSLAAGIVMATIPGLRFFHDGQLEGRRIHLPVQLVREPEEADEPGVVRFYDRLLKICNDPAFHEGEWRLVEVGQGWEGNETHHNLLAWFWRYEEQIKIVVVNYSPDQAQAWLQLPLSLQKTESMILRDELNDATYVRDTEELRHRGLYIDLNPWHAHSFDLSAG